MMRSFLRSINTIFFSGYRSFHWFMFIVGLANIASATLAYIEYTSSSNNPIKLPFSQLLYISPWLLVIVLITWIVKLYKSSDAKTKLLQKAALFSCEIKEEIYKWDQVLINTQDDSSDIYYLRLKDLGQKVANYISIALRKCTGYEFSVCIKYFNESWSKDNGKKFEDVTMRVLCRNHDADVNRSYVHNQKSHFTEYIIKDNYDFFYIINNGVLEFFSNNLDALDKELKHNAKNKEGYYQTYQNWRDYYFTRVVVPISMEKEHKNKETFGREYVGFICVDSKKKYAFRESEAKFYILFIKIFANLLYLYFDRYNYLANFKSNHIDEKKLPEANHDEIRGNSLSMD